MLGGSASSRRASKEFLYANLKVYSRFLKATMTVPESQSYRQNATLSKGVSSKMQSANAEKKPAAQGTCHQLTWAPVPSRTIKLCCVLPSDV